MKPPAYRGFGAVHAEKAKVIQAMRPLQADDMVRGQYTGYRNEPNVDKNSDVETFCAVLFFIDSWRWEGVPCLGIDQWGVELGKVLAQRTIPELESANEPTLNHDRSTNTFEGSGQKLLAGNKGILKEQ